MLNTNGNNGRYVGFFIVYRNWFFTLLGTLRLLPRQVIVSVVNKKGSGVRLKVPVGKGISNLNPHVMLDSTTARIYKVVRIFM